MILWILVGVQLVAWGWFMYKGGMLSDKKFILYTLGMLLGQLATGVETYQQQSWRAFTTQAYFLTFTIFGGIQRYRQMKKNRTT
jgi:hypothetical protein